MNDASVEGIRNEMENNNSNKRNSCCDCKSIGRDREKGRCMTDRFVMVIGVVAVVLGVGFGMCLSVCVSLSVCMSDFRTRLSFLRLKAHEVFPRGMTPIVLSSPFSSA